MQPRIVKRMQPFVIHDHGTHYTLEQSMCEEGQGGYKLIGVGLDLDWLIEGMVEHKAMLREGGGRGSKVWEGRGES